MLQNIALAASGSDSAGSLERFAFDYCLKKGADEILVIHVVDTHLARYGEIDQLASGNCKDEFIGYIKQTARTTSQSLYNRVQKTAATYGVTMNWLQVEGEVVKEICTIVKANQISTLIIGTGVVPKTFFAPPKKNAFNLSKKCACEVIAVPPSR